MKYRAEIDGLRAVAVIPVILCHAGFDLFCGGFVGVDVFFVISGYLITTIILTEKELGIFSLSNFYERRMRRILPALFLVMFVSIPLAWLWLLPNQLKDFSRSLVAVSTVTSNVFFWLDGGYWGVTNELKPLLHTWSLAVEEQYYTLFPLYLIFMWKFCKQWILGSFLVIPLTSLLIAQWGIYHYPEAAFFLMPTRLWELAVGANIAFYSIYRKQTIRTFLPYTFVKELLSLAGLLMISFAIVVYDENIPFPGVYALMPTAGAALIILFSSSNTYVGKLLSIKPLVVMGQISYSLYLWHQPLFVMARSQSLSEPRKLTFVIFITLSIILAYLSWRFIENPFRKKEAFSRKAIYFFSAAGSALFILIGLIGYENNGFPNRFKLKKSVQDSFVKHNLRNNCNKTESGIEVCTLGSKTNDTEIEFAVVGDSHSMMILPAFDQAARATNAKFVHLGMDGCIPLLNVDVAQGNYQNGICEKVISKQFEFIKNHSIKKVFLVARWSLYTDGSESRKKQYYLVDKDSQRLTRNASRSVFERGIQNTITAYQNIGVKVYIFNQIPQQQTNVQMLYYKLSNSSLSDSEVDNAIAGLSISRKSSNELQAFNRGLFNHLASDQKVEVVNLDEYFCNSEACAIGDNMRSYYFDNDHISVSGAALIVNEVKKHIQ